jgi:hypothetical protein
MNVVVNTRSHIQQQAVHKRLFQLTVLSLVILFIGGGIALLLQLSGTHFAVQQAKATLFSSQQQGGDLSVVGSPSLPAATVDAIFARVGSPMVGTGKVIEQVAGQEHIDDAFALAVWWTETNDGLTGVGLAYHNPGGVREGAGYPSGSGGYTIYPSYAAAVTYWFQMLRSYYVDHGLSTVYAISHPYVGTSSSYLWAGKVVALMLRYHAEAPPPGPTPTLAPKPTVSTTILRNAKMVASSDANFSLSRLEVQEPARQATSVTAQMSSADALPASFVNIIVLFALFLALLIAAWALKIGLDTRVISRFQSLPTSHATGGTVLQTFSAVSETHVHALAYQRSDWPAQPSAEMHTPHAVNTFHPVPAPFYALTFATEKKTASPLRRTILLPSLPDTGELARESTPTASGVDPHPAGLLSRYGKRQQNW